ncbi:MAG: hypothetical protein N2109_05235 [Fimbriimonadales bacterium]|nr:hypothetical protein [Fimbriimonadales bacterium]
MRRRAFVSWMVLGILFVLLALGIGLVGTTTNTLARAVREVRYQQAFDVAQAGLEYAVSKAYELAEGNGGDFLSADEDLTATLGDLGLQPGDQVQSSVRPGSAGFVAWVTCTARVRGVTRSLRTFVSTKDVSIWNNAIFAGTGATGRAINGNVDIRGSVHILGDGEYYSDLNGNGRWDSAETFTDTNRNGVWDPGEPFVDRNGDGVWNSAEPYNDTNANGIYDPPLTTTELSTSLGGTAYIGNNYSGMPADLRALVPAPPVVGGVQTLGTEVRVKHGLVSISGNASIGTNAIVDAGLSKNTVDGVYVNDGFTGNKGAAGVFSDNGTSNAYDLGHLDMGFPVVAGIGAEPYRDSTGTVWSNQEAFLEARSLRVSLSAIRDSTPAFTVGPDAYGNRISWTPGTKSTPGVLEVYGIVRFPGDLQLGDSKATIRYRGSGTLYARRDINISANLLPAVGQVFPTTSRLGILAMRNIGLATGSGDAQLSMAAAFYAQGTITSAKQNQIAGTFVANFFNMGTNVPNIYQVPDLRRNLPPGMPGDKPYVTLRLRSWRERRVAQSTLSVPAP